MSMKCQLFKTPFLYKDINIITISASIYPLYPATCSDPTAPRNGVIEAYQTTLEGAEIFFRCNTGYVPAGKTRAVCGTNGRWNPEPADHRCTGEIIMFYHVTYNDEE